MKMTRKSHSIFAVDINFISGTHSLVYKVQNQQPSLNKVGFLSLFYSAHVFARSTKHLRAKVGGLDITKTAVYLENEAITSIAFSCKLSKCHCAPWYFQENSNNPEKSRLASIYVRPVDIICRSRTVPTWLLQFKWWFSTFPQNKLLLQCNLSLFLSLCTKTCTPMQVHV